MMKEFVKDYCELLAENGRFYKKHWLGCLIVTVVSGVATYAYIRKDDIMYEIETRLHKD